MNEFRWQQNTILPYIWGRKWQPTQYSCLENPVDREAWWTADHKVAYD